MMRLEEPFVYRMTQPAKSQAVFEFIAQHGPVDVREMYATFNMGAGFAAYVGPADAGACVRLANESGYHAALLNLGELKQASEDQLLAHSQSVAEVIPLVVSCARSTTRLGSASRRP